MTNRPFARYGALLSVGLALVWPASAAVAAPVRAVRAATERSGPRVSCVAASHANDKRAIKMAHAIDRAIAGRASTIGLEETDAGTRITCTYHATWHFYAASAIKATILAALLRKAQEQHRNLTTNEKHLAWLMITQSDNDAATALWNDVGFSHLQHFLRLAKMSETELNHAWGLSLLTAHDETLLLALLGGPNRILSLASRVYAQYLMSHVIASQRWGVPAGAPHSVTVHVKNGWLPYPVSDDWEINSIGFFTRQHPQRVYTIAVLTHANPTMAYGIDTIEGAAIAIHRALNPGADDVIPRSRPNATWGIPDEPVPAAKG
ncbi:MAG: serine hydrolase [Streptosporangiaceae bacterium]